MDPKLKHIVEFSDLLTQSEIKDYASGVGLSKAERYRIELKITNNPANQELLDAYVQNPNIFKPYKNFKNPLDDYQIEGLVLFTSLFSIIILAVFSFWPFEINETNLIEVHDVKNIQVEKFERLYTPVKKENPEFFETVDHQNTTTVDKIIHNEYQDIEFIESKTLKRIDSNIPNDGKIKIKRKYPSVYLGKFKTTDYRSIRAKETISVIHLPGLSADIENTDSDTLINSFDRVPEAYIDHLRLILKHFQKKNFETSIKLFTLILEDFPDDDNALFYRGLSYYHLDLTEQSIRDLKAVIENTLSNFDEEAEWYLALNYQKSGQNQKFKTALEAIINRQAFYAKEAQKRYQLCKN